MKIAYFLLAASLTLGASSIAFAQDQGAGGGMGGGMGGGRGRLAACADDSAKFCADKTGRDRRTCLMANQDKVSAACKAALTAPPAGGGVSGGGN